MKVPHHGSADPGLPEVLERLRPEVAAIEVGADNTYGHPAPVRRCAALGPPASRPIAPTGDGTVTLTVVDGRVRVATER